MRAAWGIGLSRPLAPLLPLLYACRVSRGRRMATTEVIIGVVLILAAIWLAWAMRPSSGGVVHRMMLLPTIEPYSPIIVLMLLLAGAILIAIGLGVEIGPPNIT